MILKQDFVLLVDSLLDTEKQVIISGTPPSPPSHHALVM